MPPSAAVSGGPIDPHRIGTAIGGIGMFSRRAGKVAFAVIATVLDDNETVEVLVQGRFRGEDGAAVLTNRRLVLANDREWKPDIEVVQLSPGLTVQGWQDDRSAALAFNRGDASTVIDQIGEKDSAQRMAAAVRARVG
jgi:hypothetical protein